MKLSFDHKRFRGEKLGLVRSLSLVLLGLLATGCPANKSDSGTGASQTNKIVIKGSNTIGEELGPRLVAEYKKQHPEVAISLETKGSGSGFWGVIAGVCDIAAASRAPLADERQQAEYHGVQLNDNVIGAYSVAVVVHPSSPVGNLTKEQVRDVFTGVVQNWKDIGGPDAPIHLYIRNPVSGTYLGFRELALEDKAYGTNNVSEVADYPAIAQDVAKDANGIGYSTVQLASKSGVKAVTIGGVAPGASTVNEGKYPYARVLHFYTDKTKEGSATREFVQFVLSARGQTIMDEMGFIPHP